VSRIDDVPGFNAEVIAELPLASLKIVAVPRLVAKLDGLGSGSRES
jgi:hypothetical protein